MIRHVLLALSLLAASACDASRNDPAMSAVEQHTTLLGNAGAAVSLPAGNSNDYYLGGQGVLPFVAHASGSTVTGFDTGSTTDGELLLVVNYGTVPVVLAHQSTASTATMRMISPTGSDISLSQYQAAWIFRDENTTYRWIIHLGPTGPQGATGATGATGAVGATGAAGADGAGFGVITTSTPSRSLGSAFCPSATRPVMGYYSVRVDSSLSLTTGARGRVELLSDASNPPTTIRARIAGGSTGTLAVGLSLADTSEAPLSYLIPAGHCVLIRSVDEVGTPTYTLTTQAEQTL